MSVDDQGLTDAEQTEARVIAHFFLTGGHAGALPTWWGIMDASKRLSCPPWTLPKLSAPERVPSLWVRRAYMQREVEFMIQREQQAIAQRQAVQRQSTGLLVPNGVRVQGQ